MHYSEFLPFLNFLILFICSYDERASDRLMNLTDRYFIRKAIQKVLDTESQTEIL